MNWVLRGVRKSSSREVSVGAGRSSMVVMLVGKEFE